MAAATQANGTWSPSNVMQTGREALGMSSARDFELESDEVTEEAEEQTLPVMQAVRMIGGAVVGIAVIVLVVNEVLTIGAVSNSTGPFAGVIDSLETTGVAAMTLLVVGLVVVAAQQIMSYMGGGF
jgi:hypothetical protein